MSQDKIECPVNMDVKCLYDCENCNYYYFFKLMENNTSTSKIKSEEPNIKSVGLSEEGSD